MDYLFASRELAEGPLSCDVLNTEEWRIRSDHFPIVADFAG
jgi:endonuclease/exonuclease/phosphatase family metal-dependent hydrolase